MKSVNPTPSRVARFLRVGMAGIASLVVVAGLSSGCLDRPVAEQDPQTSNIFVEQFTQTAVDKIDLLFMIDNSQSMADKQALLAEAVPQLLERLLNPPCFDGNGAIVDQPSNPNVECANGDREFTPVADVHIGVITSSLGGHGGKFCTAEIQGNFDPTMNDQGYLLPFVRSGLPSYGDQGFLAWDNRPAEQRDPTATNDVAALIADFTNHVISAGEVGCGFEASLEAWYRFLVDPQPYAEVAVDAASGQAYRNGIDQQLLGMRAQFLRPDSLVAVIMLSDENDCSIVDGGYGLLVTTFARGNPPREFNMPRAAAACSSPDYGPNDPCCVSCRTTVEAWPAGCPSLEDSCPSLDLAADEDKSNLRCFDQKRRYGLDLLYPTSRYSVGLKSTVLCPESSFGDADCECTRAEAVGRQCNPGTPVANPLYAQGGSLVGRGPDLVFLAGIVGVPWQDIATEDTRDPANASLSYMTAAELNQPGPGQGDTGASFWDMIVGWPHLGIPPADPFMVESRLPRSGANPITGDQLQPVDSNVALANRINGHEWSTQDNDLQYACIFPLEQAPDCSADGAAAACDCPVSDRPDDQGNVDAYEEVNTQRKPLCQDPASGALGFVQHYAKAYPGLRELEVLREYGENSIVASVCPKTQGAGPDAGYKPAVAAIIDRLKEKLGGRCLPRPLSADDTGRVPCEVVEASRVDSCNCAGSGRGAIENPELQGAVRRALKSAGACENSEVEGSPNCDSFCMCSINQLLDDGPGSEGHTCKTSIDDPTNVAGYCYVDPVAANNGDVVAAQNDPSWGLVSSCPAGQKRLLRFVGNNTPATGAVTFIACAGDTFQR